MKFILILFLKALGQIKYDSGQNTDFYSASQPSFACKNSYQLSKTINFNGAFQNIPQVFIQQSLSDIEPGNVEFRLSITSVTLTNFIVQIQCPSSKRIYSLQFRWFAIDDQRVQVISAFNIDNPTMSKTYQHLNANAENGIIFLTSISIIGPIDFVLSLSSITKTSVTVDISNPSGKFVNLKQIGYQIVLGTSEIFNMLGIQTVTTTSYTSQNFNLQTNKWILTPIVGFQFDNNQYLQFRWTYTYTASTVSCKVDSWDKLVKHTHLTALMSYVINTLYQPLQTQTIRISQKIDLEALNRPTVYAELPQTNEVFNQIGTFTTIIDKSISPVLINVIIKCSFAKKIKSQFNKCNNCSFQKFYLYSHNCNNQINQISYFSRYLPTNSAHQELTIIISDKRIQINQITYNQVAAVNNILDIEQLNI
ncbi:unnamed protein product [Paramecium pentaurelia]|uniref:H-type lectin domain-containing protein n=1 Tax=Paramecium pentaurelia TaxID=43138 RepID=A0A8S1WH09_9CILI|nr:unnamed protein product [Paramecium pentaurelia]